MSIIPGRVLTEGDGWYEFVQCLPSAEICEVLDRAGLKPAASGRFPGLLLFSAIDAKVIAAISQKTNHGGHRILAVAFGLAQISATDRWAILRAGASDLLIWDHAASVPEILARLGRWNEVERLMESDVVRSVLVGDGPVWLAVIREVVEVAAFTATPVLITGESGTGKELVARIIHALDRRSDKGEFVLLDCTTVVPELSGSEFFGHERGAYTGAVAPRDGAFALANGGTLFLDEVGELPLQLQASLLRVSQEHTFKRVGSNVWKETNFRLICATNRRLLDEQSRGAFRRDLYYRIAGCTLTLPPLRDRREDIVPLARHFLRQLRASDEEADFDDGVCSYLLARDYPGNVRDLKQIVGRMAYRHAGRGKITLGDVPSDDRPNEALATEDWRGEAFRRSVSHALALGHGLKEIGRAAEEIAEEIVVAQEGGNLQRAARRLGITDRALQLHRAARRGVIACG